MDDTEDDARYPPNPYGMNQGYGSSHRPKLPVRNSSYSQHVSNQYDVEEGDDGDDDGDDDDVEEEVEVEEEEEDDEDGNEYKSIQRNGKGEDDDDNEDDGDEDEDDDNRSDYNRRIENTDLQRHQKKRKLKSLLSSYEFAPRVPPPSGPSATTASVPKPLFGGRNSLADWTEHESFILLDSWGDRFLQRGRKSLRSDEWQEVAEKVSQESKFDRTDTQCRNRLDTLKKKYKKEKMKLEGAVGTTTKWVYFKKMDMLMSSSPPQAGLSCGMDSGEYVFMNPREYLNRANVLDEMRDSPGNSESAEGEDDLDLLPPKRTRTRGGRGDGASFRLLADSIQKFSEIYEKIENSKRQQMLELEKMRMDFHRELELQKRQILERAQAEIAKMQQGDDEENDVSN